MDEDDLPPARHELSASAAALRAGLAMSDLEIADLVVGYLTVGGTMSPAEVREVLRGEREVSAIEHDYLAQALNDYFTVRGQDHPVAYAEDLGHEDERPVTGTRRRRPES